MISTLADSAHFLTRPVISSGSGLHQTPVATLDLAMDLESGPVLIGPTLMKSGEIKNVVRRLEGAWEPTYLEPMICVGISKRGEPACMTKKPSAEQNGKRGESSILVASRTGSQPSKGDREP